MNSAMKISGEINFMLDSFFLEYSMGAIWGWCLFDLFCYTHLFLSPPFSFLPFSTGRRGCLGEAVAKVELHLLTAMLFQRYFFAPPAGTQLKVEPIPAGEECIAAPYKVVATRRH